MCNRISQVKGHPKSHRSFIESMDTSSHVWNISQREGSGQLHTHERKKNRAGILAQRAPQLYSAVLEKHTHKGKTSPLERKS